MVEVLGTWIHIIRLMWDVPYRHFSEHFVAQLISSADKRKSIYIYKYISNVFAVLRNSNIFPQSLERALKSTNIPHMFSSP